MFRFASDHFLFLFLLLPLLALFLRYAFVQRSKALGRFADLELVAKLSQAVSRSGRIWKAALVVAAVGLLVTALARPQFGTRIETVQRQGQDVIIALDVSLSMMAEDIAPNRLEKAKHAIAGLIDRLQGDRVGLVAFAGEAFLQCPLTLDYAAARMFLRSMEPDLVPVPGTALADAVDRSLDAFEAGETQHRVLILITDGEDHEGQPVEAAQRAAEKGVRIFTVGIGSPQGVPIPVLDANGRQRGFKRDDQGQVVTTKLDEATLQEIARIGTGAYFRATPGADELGELAGEITGMEKKELTAREFTQFDEQYQGFLALALALLLAEFLIPERKSARGEWKGRFQ